MYTPGVKPQNGRSRAWASAGLLGLLVTAVTGGCSTGPVGRRDESRFRLHGSDAPGAVVFAHPAVLAAEGEEVARRDWELSPRYVGAITARDQWPQEPRPSLGRTRRLLIDPREGEFFYFRAEPDRTERWRRSWY